MIASCGFLAALECTKFVFGRGSAPASLGSIHQLSSRPSSRFKEPYLQGEDEGRERGKGEKRRGRELEGPAPLLRIPRSAPSLEKPRHALAA